MMNAFVAPKRTPDCLLDQNIVDTASLGRAPREFLIALRRRPGSPCVFFAVFQHRLLDILPPRPGEGSCLPPCPGSEFPLCCREENAIRPVPQNAFRQQDSPDPADRDRHRLCDFRRALPAEVLFNYFHEKSFLPLRARLLSGRIPSWRVGFLEFSDRPAEERYPKIILWVHRGKGKSNLSAQYLSSSSLSSLEYADSSR